MIFVLYKNKNSLLEKIEVQDINNIPSNIIWIDLLKPSFEEEIYIEKILNVEAPTQREMNKFEIVSPFYTHRDIKYMTITILDKNCKCYPVSTAITFILTNTFLISIRYETPQSFDYMDSWIIRYKMKSSIAPNQILMVIIEFIINCSGDILEEIGNKIDDLLKIIFNKSIEKENNFLFFYNEIIKNISNIGTIISKNIESLVSINRMLLYFSQINNNNFFNRRNFILRTKQIVREISSLNEYANFLSQRNNFLLDATLGMISVEQNLITKFFTVATAIFMPSTLITGIYGMNFHFMPELNLKWSYYIVLLSIFLSLLLSYIFFKKKNWF